MGKSGEGVQMRQLESSIERRFVKDAKALGCLVYKLHEKDAPDRLILLPGGKPVFFEFKRSGGKPRPSQAYEHERLRARGFPVYAPDSYDKAMEALRNHMYK